MSEVNEMRWYRSDCSDGEVIKHEREWHSQFLLEGENGKRQPMWVIYKVYAPKAANGHEWFLLQVSEWDVNGPFDSSVEAMEFFRDIAEEASKVGAK